MRSSGNSSVPPIPVPEPKPSPIRDRARQLMVELAPRAQVRIANATAEVHDIITGLNMAAARVERLRVAGLQHAETQDCDLPDGIPTCKPGDSFNMPGDLGEEFFETSPEVFFWGALALPEVRAGIAEIATILSHDLRSTDSIYMLTRAEELLARLPAAMLNALRARMAELARPEVRELRVASFTVHATAQQGARWKQAAETEGFSSAGAWLACAADAYLKARARAGGAQPCRGAAGASWCGWRTARS